MRENQKKSKEQEELENEVRLEALRSRFRELSEHLKKLSDDIKKTSAEMHKIAEFVRAASPKKSKGPKS